MQISNRIKTLTAEAEVALAPYFAEVDRIAFENTERVMDAFREHRVAMTNFDGTSGYGYDDRGRDVLDEIWAEVMGAEAAIVRHQIVSGTHALTIGLFGILHGIFESLLIPRELGTAVILTRKITPCELDILLCEARRAPFGRGRQVVLSIPAHLLREGMGEEGTLTEEYAELVEKYEATLCVCAEPTVRDT